MARKNRKKNNTKKKAKSKAPGGFLQKERHSEVFGVIFSLAAAVLFLSLASFDRSDPILSNSGATAINWVGLVGAYLADSLFGLLGLAAFLLVASMIYAAVMAFTRGAVRLTASKASGYGGLVLLGTALAHVALAGHHPMGHAPGGLMGELLGGLFVAGLSVPGALVVLSASMLMALIATTGFSIVKTGKLAGQGLVWLARRSAGGMQWVGGHAGRGLRNGFQAVSAWLLAQAKEFVEVFKHDPAARPGPISQLSGPSLDSFEPAMATAGAGHSNLLAPPISMPPPIGRREPVVVTTEPPPSSKRVEPEILIPKIEPEIVIPKAEQENDNIEERTEAGPQVQPSPDYKNFKLPTLDFLQDVPQKTDEVDKERLTEMASRLQKKLADYGIDGQVTKIMPGPVVTMYEYAPGPGIKVAKIAGLSQDLALALEAMSVRIIAPIPGRAVVGIEVSNKKTEFVYAKEIIGNKVFTKPTSKLTIALGKNIEGTPFTTDLNKMPHLLVAGATGTGKSVALNTMIASILYKATPEDVRFIMIDPKVLELSLYEGIPHLLLPVVTDPRKAQAALQWAVNEMERRIRVLYSAGVRNLDSYNHKVELHNSGEATMKTKEKYKKVQVIDRTAKREEDQVKETEIVIDAANGDEPARAFEPKEKLPHIVIVIDELADLMMTAPREVETNIARIAQKARAAGIHLIVATQRPSVNVITGLIKANLPARISFRVASKVDSRTILDANGAESLLGNGDMLFSPPTTSQLIRLHGAFITEDEIEGIVEHLKAQAEPVYDESILASAEEDADGENAEKDDDPDALSDAAVAVVAEARQASTSMVQRKLRIGYNRAARMIERMEREGIVGPPDGSKPRKVLIEHHEK